ncbi:glycosyltransferase family 4 protein [Marinomonas sp. 2405UD68-3]|uniref:glycosyltransferase family 4 protein n=1 Tax=Marinomonas sp. 2405UD68-3 TaxID=3391835 RepID=UPI0039C9CD66
MPLLNKKQDISSLVQQKLREHIVSVIRVLMGVPWLRSFALIILNRLPFFKHRLQRLLAFVPHNVTPIKRNSGNLEDYEDILEAITSVSHSADIDSLMAKNDELSVIQDIKSIRLTGHFNGSYSLASVNRHILNRCTSDFPEIDWQIQPYEGQIAPRVFDTPKGRSEVDYLNHFLKSKKNALLGSNGNVSIYHHYPLITPHLDDEVSIALFFWEESNVSQEIIDQLNEQYNGVLVTTWFVKKVLIDSGCTIPIQVVPLPLEAYPFSDKKLVTKSQESNKVTFLHVSSCFPRKGVDLLLDAFDQAAEQDESISLVIKTFPNPHNQIHFWLQQCVRPHLQARVEIIECDMSADEMALLYQGADAVVLPTRGEGLNLPAIEAGIYKKPLVVTGYGAHMDFVNQENAHLLDYRFSKADTHVNGGQSVWAEVSVPKLAEALTLLSAKIKEGDSSVKEKSEKLYQNVKKIFFDKNATQRFFLGIWEIQQYQQKKAIDQKDSIGQLYKSDLKPQVDLFSTWGEECGIAEYSQSLIYSMLPEKPTIRIHHPLKRRVIPNELDNELEFVDSWVYGGDGPDLLDRKIEGGVIWLQHHFAFYGLTHKLVRGVEFQRQQGKSIYITLHTTRPLLSYDKNNLQIAVKCLSFFERIFVHALDDLNTLKRLGLVDNVMLMPHGVKYPLLEDGSNNQINDKPFVVGSFGFLMPHKGIDILIKGFSSALQQQTIPVGSRLRLVNAVRPDGTSFYEKERCEKLIEDLNVKNNVDWYSDFLPSEECEEKLSGCDVIILPYQFTLESCSGAVRNAIISCKHVATTPAPIFDEVRDVTHSLNGYDSENIAQFLSTFIGRIKAHGYDSLLVEREKWLMDHNWPIISDRHLNVFTANKVDKSFNNGENATDESNIDGDYGLGWRVFSAAPSRTRL